MTRTRSILRKLKWFFLCLVVLVIAGITYEQISEHVTRNKYQPPGRQIDVGGYKLHMVEEGKSAGLPTVVLESGLGVPNPSEDWSKVRSRLAQVTKVISYDRAGYGWSDQADSERTASASAQDLHKLLQASGNPGPYVLVAHSYGGFIAQMFASLYPEDTAGLVMIDSSQVGQQLSFSEGQLLLMQASRITGVSRLAGTLGLVPMPDQDKVSKDLFYQMAFNRNHTSELRNMMTKSKDQVQTVESQGFGSLPLAVLAVPNEYADWLDMQKKMSGLSTNSTYHVVQNSTHFVQKDQLDLVVDTALNMLKEIGTN
ncbi:alpha/beta hydrolase [Paenibacillus sp. YPG26]|uniref:alpha/beta hydrolase n=1 Tax=Paenibacillus sp. YPG26 TaxID=2878915 RepID=UPI002040E825|nr:alpha/beta hydrolase [Paenibacillus sp. YPG26]USB34360.1 alpha/beta hydrolase [Paenibacillus sp. YPG26]